MCYFLLNHLIATISIYYPYITQYVRYKYFSIFTTKSGRNTRLFLVVTQCQVNMIIPTHFKGINVRDLNDSDVMKQLICPQTNHSNAETMERHFVTLTKVPIKVTDLGNETISTVIRKTTMVTNDFYV